MRVAVSDNGEELGIVKSVLTPGDDFEKGMRQFQAVAKELLNGKKPDAAAGGIAGSLDKEHAVLLRSPNMPGWVGKPLKEEIEKMIGAPLHIENDAALAGLGEATAGAARGYAIAAYVTVSTGVGGARIVDGKIDRNAAGFEIGHQIINYDGEARTLEEYVSGSGILRRFGKMPQEIADTAIWEEVAHALAYGLHNTILHWSPEILILGGPLILESQFPFEKCKHYLADSILPVFPSVPEVAIAELGDRSGLYGALAHLCQPR